MRRKNPRTKLMRRNPRQNKRYLSLNLIILSLFLCWSAMDRREEEEESKEGESSGHECSESIPLDLIADILLKLPAKSAVRFRCVSKIWSSITTRPYFIATQASTRRLCLRIGRRDMPFFVSLPQYGHPDKSCSHHVDRYKMNFSNFEYHKVWSESVHGLMIFGMSHGILVWNPTTREHVTLPEPMIEYKCCCLGYDPVEDKFKVLCISDVIHQVPIVITLGPQESWRETQNIPSHFSFTRTGICINGHVYYRAAAYKEFLMNFDVRYETFNTVTKPDDRTLGNLIFNYQGKLAWFCSDLSSCIRFWVFEDEKKQEWSPRSFLLPFPRFPLPDPIWEVGRNNKKKLMSFCGVAHDTGEFVYIAARYKSIIVLYYDPKRNRTRRVEYGGFGDKYTVLKINDIYCFLNHNESLMSLENFPRRYVSS